MEFKLSTVVAIPAAFVAVIIYVLALPFFFVAKLTRAKE